MNRVRSLWMALILSSLALSAARSSDIVSPAYFWPQDQARYVPAGAVIVLRLRDGIDPASLSAGLFEVRGSVSGRHAGRAVLAGDGRTVNFIPDQPFEHGESVAVAIQRGLATVSGRVFAGLEFGFTVSEADGSVRANSAELGAPTEAGEDGAWSQVSHDDNWYVLDRGHDYVTLPDTFPIMTITVPAHNTAPGSTFIAPFLFASATQNSWLMILDDRGEPVYYQAADSRLLDFKVQPNGHLTYFDQGAGQFRELDSTYSEVNTYGAVGGYTTDVHDLQLLDNGNALLMIYDPQPMDLSQLVPGGRPDATVIGLVLQEIDSQNNLIFQWDSWSHFLITDTTVATSGSLLDYVHGNAIELDADGNWLLSSRHLDEVTKIDRAGETGDIIWRMGGKNNQFTFVNDAAEPFFHQHDIRRLSNGNVTLFDNHNGHVPPWSRGVEYQLDEEARTATLVWQFYNTPSAVSPAMGNVQRLPNGNSLVGWGATYAPMLTEVTPLGVKAFEIDIQDPYTSYRAFRFPWQATPTYGPTLVTRATTETTTLFFSWNGATDVGGYTILAGRAPGNLSAIGVKAKTGFEDQFSPVMRPGQYCYFRVVATAADGTPLSSSPEVASEVPCGEDMIFLPFTRVR